MAVSTVTASSDPHWRRRIAIAVLVVTFIISSYGLLYQWVMLTFEGRPISYYQALQVVLESLTTAGFGSHAPWESDQANVMVLVMNLTGVALVFLAIPTFGTPLLREIFERPPPTSSALENHIIVCGFSEKDEVLRDELEQLGRERDRPVPFLYVEADAELVRRLIDEDIEAMVGNPERVATLRAANADRAAALVADVDDATNPSVILAAKLVAPDLPVLSVVRDGRIADHHRYAGADRVIKARESFGTSLAIRAMSSYASKFRNAVELQQRAEVTELVIEDGCPLIGKTLREAELFDEGSARNRNIIAAWVGGKFLISPRPETVIRENAIFVVAGGADTVDAEGVHPITGTPDSPSRVVVGGFGTVGKTVWSVLDENGVDTTIVDMDADRGGKPISNTGITRNGDGPERMRYPEIDVVGDITDEPTLRGADLDEADVVVLALDGDIPTIYATILIDRLATDVELIARAQNAGTISTLYQAGADFVLSLSAVTGEILASELLDILGERGGFLPASTEFEFTRTDGEDFAGLTLADVDLRTKTDCTVAAVERDGELLTDVRGDFQIRNDDVLIVAGSSEAVADFVDEFLPTWRDEHAGASTDATGTAIEDQSVDGDEPPGDDVDKTDTEPHAVTDDTETSQDTDDERVDQSAE